MKGGCRFGIRDRIYEMLLIACEAGLRRFALRSTVADGQDWHDRPNLLARIFRRRQPRAWAAPVSGKILEASVSFSRLYFTHAPIYEVNSGCGSMGRDLNSG